MLLFLAAFSSAPRAQDTFAPVSGSGGLELVDPRLGDEGSAWLAGTAFSSERISDDFRRLSGGVVSGGWVITDGLQIEADLPIYQAILVPPDIYSGVGALRVGATWSPGAPFAVSGWIQGGGVLEETAATAVGNDGITGDIRIALGGGEEFRWRANAGVLAGDAAALRIGAGGDRPISEVARLGLEVQALSDALATGAAGDEPQVSGHLYSHLGRDTSTIRGTVAVGAGLLGEGPLYRGVVGVRWWWGGSLADLDRDGLADSVDECPMTAEDLDGVNDADGCPDWDDDGDDVPDEVDLCLDAAEDYDGFQDEDGCPDEDNDSDGLVDEKDRCPNDAGPPATGGCPDSDGDGAADADDECPEIFGEAFGCPDWDEDGVPDHRDACPREPDDPTADPRRSDGCPRRAFVTPGSIEIRETVHFEFNQAIIKPESFSLLQEVAALIQANPDIRTIEIAGHTDAIGSDEYNQGLSYRRAGAVRRFLVEQGVDPSRLVVAGYGEGRPVETNATDEGRAQNRRVEFLILEVTR